MARKNNTEKLVVTNYDNFKNADFFIKQYYQAQQMLKEVEEFFESFRMSKLLTSEQLINIHPNMFLYEYGAEWTECFIDHYVIEKTHDYELLHGHSWSDKKPFTPEEKAERLKKTREATKNLCNDITIRLVGNFDCYYVLDSKNNLHEFIPVKAAHTIKTDFTKKEIIISGYYYHYHEWGAQWGNSASAMDKIVKKIIIDPATNNVKDVKEQKITISEGNANGKNYWANHENYCLTALDGKNKVISSSWDNVCKDMDHYNHELLTLNCFAYKREDKDALKKELHKKFDARYKKIYKKELTDEILHDYFSVLKN
jgi:hypothetical protein